MSTYSISKSFFFEAAHRLHKMPPNHKCFSLHGHSYSLTVTICEDTLNASSMVKDYGELQPVKDWIDEHLDHSVIVAYTDKDLSEVAHVLKSKVYIFPVEHTTCEAMSFNLAGIFRDLLQLDSETQIIITLSETQKTSCTFSLISGLYLQ